MPAPSMPNLGIKITDNTKFDANARDEESKNILVLRIACKVTPRILDDINTQVLINNQVNEIRMSKGNDKKKDLIPSR